MNIKSLTERLCVACGSRDPFVIADFLDVNIIQKPLGNLLGYYIKIYGEKFIVINSNIENMDHIRTITAHELGHAVLHENCDYPYFSSSFFLKSKPEREANEFAAELLIPDELMYSSPGLTIQELAYSAHCSSELFQFKKI